MTQFLIKLDIRTLSMNQFFNFKEILEWTYFKARRRFLLCDVKIYSSMLCR